MPKTYDDEDWCGICKADTIQTIHDSEHERDSSGDWRKCHKCGGTYSGMTGEWEKAKTVVVNLRKERCDVKITRRPDNTIPDPPKSGCFGNPFPVGTHGREECLRLFEEYFLDRLETDTAFAEAVLSLQGKRLGCVCKPKACHGDIIKRWLDEQV